MTIVSKAVKDANIKAFNALDNILGVKQDNIPSKTITDSFGSMPDLRQVQLNESVLSELFTGKANKESKKDSPKVVEESKDVKLAKLVTQLAALLAEAKILMSEMTTTGMIATNQKFAFGKKKPKSKMDRFRMLLKGNK